MNIITLNHTAILATPESARAEPDRFFLRMHAWTWKNSLVHETIELPCEYVLFGSKEERENVRQAYREL